MPRLTSCRLTEAAGRERRPVQGAEFHPAEGAGSAGGPYAGLDIVAFSAETTEYAATVPHGTTHTRLTATAADPDATLKAGAGSSLSALSSGAASAAVPLEVAQTCCRWR